MLSTILRLRHSKDIEFLFKNGRFVNGRFLTLTFCKIPDQISEKRKYPKDNSFLAVITGKKFHRLAVKRNFGKRRARAAFQTVSKNLAIKHGFLLAITPRPEILVADFEDLKSELTNLIKKSGLCEK